MCVYVKMVGVEAAEGRRPVTQDVAGRRMVFTTRPEAVMVGLEANCNQSRFLFEG